MKFILWACLFVAPSAFAAVQVDKYLNWAEQYEKQYANGATFAEVPGVTADGRPCEMALTNQNAESSNGRQQYLSLGTSTGGTNKANYYWIGTFIMESDAAYVNRLDVTAKNIHLDVTIGNVEGDPNPTEQDDLLILLDAKGKATQIQGSSSYWPSSTCYLK